MGLVTVNVEIAALSLQVAQPYVAKADWLR